MSWRERIVEDAAVNGGKPTISGTRISVEFVLELFAQGWSETMILEQYGQLVQDDLLVCFKFALDAVRARRG